MLELSGSDCLSVLVDAGLKGFVVLALAAVSVLLMRRTSAALRYQVWLTAVLALLGLPVLFMLVPSWKVLPNWFEREDTVIGNTATNQISSLMERDISFGNKTVMIEVQETESTISLSEYSPGITPLSESREEDISATQERHGMGFWLLAVWSVGVLISSAITCLGVIGLARQEKRAQHVTERSWSGLVEQLASQLELCRPVCLLLSSKQVMPMVWGILKIKVLLPQEAVHWDSDRRGFVLLHELAHAKRWDYLTHLLTRLACSLHWFNPLVWVASQRMAIERERACDDLVLKGGSEPARYAEELLQVVAGLQRPLSFSAAAIAMANPSKLESRLKAILDVTMNRRSLTREGLIVCLLSSLCLVVPLASLSPMATGETITRMRTVHFPEQYSLGRVSVVELTGLESDWIDSRDLGQAQGEVMVPADKALRLTVSDTGLSHLSALGTLKPDDLQVISFNGRVNDAHLAQLPVIKGLKRIVTYAPTLGNEGLKAISRQISLVSLRVTDGVYTDQGVAYLKNLNSLQALDLGLQITDQGLAHLSEIKTLKSISMSGNEHVTDVGVACLADLPVLEQLTLDRLNITGSGFESFTQQGALCRLRLNSSAITDAGLVHVGKLESLESLSLYSTQITDEGIKHLEGLSALRELNLDNTSTGDASAASLAKLTSLESLDLSPWHTDAALNALKPLSHLKHLDMSQVKLTTEGLNSLGHFSNLEYLRLPQGVKDISFLRRLPRLEDLFIHHAQLTRDMSDCLETLQSLKRLSLSRIEAVDGYSWLARLTYLEELRWLMYEPEQSGVMGDGILEAVSGLKHLRILELDDIKATERGCQSLQHLKALEELTFSVAGITDAAMSGLKRTNALKRLTLRGDTISANGVEYLANIESLRELHLSVPDGDIKTLLPLADSDSLTSINITGFSTDATSLPYIKAIAKHFNLRISGTSISDQDRADIERQVPNCHFMIRRPWGVVTTAPPQVKPE